MGCRALGLLTLSFTFSEDLSSVYVASGLILGSGDTAVAKTGPFCLPELRVETRDFLHTSRVLDLTSKRLGGLENFFTFPPSLLPALPPPALPPLPLLIHIPQPGPRTPHLLGLRPS